MQRPRILILRTSALGDIVHALPVLTALRRHYPGAHVGWVVEKAFAPLLEDHPDIDDLLPVRLRVWRRHLSSADTWKEIGAFLSRLHSFSADVVLDLMGNHKAALLAALSLCDRRIGHSFRFRREPLSAMWISETVDARGLHAVDRMLSVLDGLGLPAEPANFGGERLREADHPPVLPTVRFAVIHPATGWKNKDYPASRWSRVASRIAADDIPVLVAPGPGEQALSERIASDSIGDVQAIDPPSFPSLVALQRQAALVLGGDTGPVHLARALGTPVLCVMGPTDPEKHGPYSALDQALWTRLACSFCHKRFDSAKACLLAIEPDLVADRALRLLDSKLH